MLARWLWAAALAAAALSGQTPAPESAPSYAGTEVCKACHEDIAKVFLSKNPHRTLESAGKWKDQSCESCHGQGSKHSEGADPKLIAAATDRTCLGCHGRQTNAHTRQQVSCASCHPVHKAAPPPAAQCDSCHTGTKLAFGKPHTHPVSRGAMQCVDCHSPHGSPVKDARTGCLKCHGDKRGPFRYEHAPMRAEGCMACHEPHGSVNPRMLARPNIAQSCLECHSSVTGGFGGAPPAFHDLRSARYQNCTTCHIKIHGSHVNRSFLR